MEAMDNGHGTARSGVPALINGFSSCSVQRDVSAECWATANQLSRALDPAANKKQRGATAVRTPLEVAECRNAPEDHVIEKGVHLSEAVLLVTVLPDVVVPRALDSTLVQ